MTESLNEADRHIDGATLKTLKLSIQPERLMALKNDACKKSGALIEALKHSTGGIDEKIRITHELTGMLGSFGLKLACLETERFEKFIREGAETPAATQNLGDLLEISWRLLEQELETPDPSDP